ncbi:WXG100 family type VII secretion target [Nocardia stercoris]|uniref:ESAT-6-like protein n=1 Tax=Nocardia stercoris TaxID=2483361 RepID=A0A3M2L368_9NOCA|nr:WXG100 family type VII secretion target [Nocardia stercoris]RMI31834.1 WXG100 family type VII secretion target [Nocardia stercoris]
MAAANMKYSQEQLDQKVQDFTDLHDILNKAITELRTETDAIPSKWGGTAANAFITLMDSFTDKFKSMNDTLMQTADSLKTAGKTFQAQDETNKAQVSQLMGSLDLPGL